MKLSRIFTISVCALTLTLSAFATQKSILLSGDSTLNGQKLKAGEYKVDYQVKGQNAEVKFIRNNKVVASATGEVVTLDKPANDSTIQRSSNPDGTSTITEIQFEKDKSAVRFSGEPSNKGN
jgi:hypothetical protein